MMYLKIYFWIILCIVLAGIIQACIYPSGDISWLLQTTGSLLHGGRYGYDFFETNPPLILYLYIPPVIFNQFFSAFIVASFKIYIFMLAIGMFFICNITLKKIFIPQNNNIRYVLLITIIFTFLLLPAGDLGQREHLMAMLGLPYFFLAILRAERQTVRKSLAYIIGIISGIGFSIKPYFFMAPCLIEIYLIIKNKKLFFWFRPEILAVILVVIIYCISIIIFTPDYLTVMLPLVNDLYLRGLPYSLWQMCFSLPVFAWLLLMSSCLMGKDHQPYWQFDCILLLSATGFLLVFIVQRALWYYHWIPYLIISTLLLVKILVCNYLNQDKAQFRIILQTTVACITLVGFSWIAFSFTSYKNLVQAFSTESYINTTRALVTKYAAGGTIYFLYPFVSGAYPVVDYAPVRSASRFPGLIFLPGLTQLLDIPENKHVVSKTLREKTMDTQCRDTGFL